MARWTWTRASAFPNARQMTWPQTSSLQRQPGWRGSGHQLWIRGFKSHTMTYVLTRPLASLQILSRHFPRHNLATPLLPSERCAHFLHLPRVWKKPNYFATCRISFCIELDLSWIGWSGRRPLRRGQLGRPSAPATRWLLHLRKPPQARPMWLQKEPGDRRVN